LDHKQQHHEHHQKEREKEIEEKKLRERAEAKQTRQIHPGWFVALGTVLVLAVVVTWIYLTS
jgi:hypothetical protein